MKAISIRQPWAWLIIRPDVTDPAARARLAEIDAIKDIENRNWPTKVRGRVLVHAAKGMTRDEYADADDYWYFSGGPAIELPPFEELQRGGIVGSVGIVDCVSKSTSRWFCGRHGFVLRDSRPLPFVPLNNRYGDDWDTPVVAIHRNTERSFAWRAAGEARIAVIVNAVAQAWSIGANYLAGQGVQLAVRDAVALGHLEVVEETALGPIVRLASKHREAMERQRHLHASGCEAA